MNCSIFLSRENLKDGKRQAKKRIMAEGKGHREMECEIDGAGMRRFHLGGVCVHVLFFLLLKAWFAD